MDKTVITTGLIAGLVGLACTVVFLQVIPLRDQSGYKEVPNEAKVLEALDANLRETGIYLLPGHSPPDSLFRERYARGPLFRIHVLQNGADGAARFLVSVIALLVAPIIPTWHIWSLCRNGRPGFGSRVLRVASFGVFLVLWADLRMWGMELFPLNYTLVLAASSVATWGVVGLVVAWRIRPAPAATVRIAMDSF